MKKSILKQLKNLRRIKGCAPKEPDLNDLLCTFAELKSSWFYLPKDPNKTSFFKCSDRDAMNRDYKLLGPISPDEEVVPISYG